jgi:hypothetical protein
MRSPAAWRWRTGRQYATESRGTFVHKCVLSGGAGPIDLAAAWPADRVQAQREMSALRLRPVAWPGSGWIDRTSAPRPRDRFLLTIPECMMPYWLGVHSSRCTMSIVRVCGHGLWLCGVALFVGGSGGVDCFQAAAL